MDTPSTMTYTKMLTAHEKDRLAHALAALGDYPAGRPTEAFVSALGLSPQKATLLLKELAAEKFIRVENDRIHADMNTKGGGKVTFSRGTARRTELLQKSAAGRAVLAQERRA